MNCRQPTNAPVLYTKTVIAQTIISANVPQLINCDCSQPNTAQQCFIIVAGPKT
jgi:hypothetical protein